MYMQITKACPECGNVEFNINSSFENYELICNNCQNQISKISLERYVQLEANCYNCGSKSFKVKVKKLGDRELWTAVCTACGNTPRKYCSDEDGNEITYDEREKLILKNDEEMYFQLNNPVDENYDVEEVISNLEDEIDEREEEIRLLKVEINSKEDEIRVLKNELDDRDDEIQDLNKRLVRYINNMSELQEEIDNLRKDY